MQNEISTVTLVWNTQGGEKLLLKMARVSSKNPDSGNTGLVKYLIREKHWSPFEMINLCVEIHCPRDIGRQILRHRSFSFQEFSQRYQKISLIQNSNINRETRTQDSKNRQASNEIEETDPRVKYFESAQKTMWDLSTKLYEGALQKGIAKECARVLLPEGLTQSKMYMNGTLRSWIHYVKLRESNGTQKEHREIALKVKFIIKRVYPILYAAAWPREDVIDIRDIE